MTELTGIRPRRWYSETIRSAIFACVVAVVGAVLIGGLTSFAQQYLPAWMNSLSNSAGGWTMFSFLLVWLGRSRPLLAAILGVVVFELLNESYGFVSGLRGFPYGAPFTSIWTVVGFLAGPLLGVAASLTRHGTPLWRALGVTPLSAVLVGEGIWALATLTKTTSPIYWSLEVALAVVFLSVAIARTRIRAKWIALVIGVWLAGSLALLGVCAFVLS